MKSIVLAAALVMGASAALAGPGMCGSAKPTTAQAPIQTPAPTS
jgi:hypothetical protein